jgi:LmbE family N-acetylglucosaminyl deacetylase
MLPVSLGKQGEKLRLLCVGAHCDDIEIGCGGTVMRLGEEYRIDHVKWLILTSNAERSVEARMSADHFLKNFKSKEVLIRDYKDGHLPFAASDVKALFEDLKSFEPDLILTHYRGDLHQDHRLLSDLSWNTFRDHMILEYEIPKYDGDLGHPNFFVSLTEEMVEKKVQSIMNFFPSQAPKPWFDRETFYSLLRLRGMESASKTRYAEAFYFRKAVM